MAIYALYILPTIGMPSLQPGTSHGSLPHPTGFGRESRKLQGTNKMSKTSDSKPYTKAYELSKWKSLQPNQNPYPHMSAIPYKAEGSTYGACGVRIDGSPEFIDAVLSCIKGLIDGENDETRLTLARSQVKGVTIKGKTKAFNNTARQAEVCYIRLHERGDEAKACNQFVRGLRERNPGASCLAEAMDMEAGREAWA